MRRLTLLTGAVAAFSVLPAQTRPAEYYNPVWSPDGRAIAFESNRDGTFAVYVIAAAGGEPRRISAANLVAEQPAWSPDGRTIVFSAAENGKRQLYRVNPDGTAQAPIPNTSGGFLTSFAPHGEWLLFGVQGDRGMEGERRLFDYHVYVSRPDGSARRQLGDSTLDNEDARWSKDGSQIVFTQIPILERESGELPRDFVKRRNAAGRRFSITPAGTGKQPIDTAAARALSRDALLAPDGRSILRELPRATGIGVEDVATGRRRIVAGVAP